MNSSIVNSSIKHVFVLMLENRSFDHMLGYSNISGKDAVSGTSTVIDGLTNNSNEYDGVTYASTPNASFKLSIDPGHEFMDTFKQICGSDALYDSKTGYNLPKPMSGFVWDYVNSPSKDEGKATSNYGDIMQAYDTKTQLPILYTLASEYVVCDRYFASVPGPTWPNRLFIQGASSMGLDDSPSNLEIIKWDTVDGFEYKNGSIYDAMDKKGIPWKIYSGIKCPIEGSIPMVAALKGITLNKWSYFDSFAEDLKGDYNYFYTFIEPNYGNTISGTYNGGQSQHPCDDVRGGEKLIKNVYESIRASKLWDSSVLIITYDEHGGFYDHIVPPKTVPPNDSMEYSKNNFDFSQLGIRVPTIIVSPLIEKNLIDHTVYDHTSILSTIEKIINIPPLTNRDANANDFLHLFTLQHPRECVETLPEVFISDNKNDPECEFKNIDLLKCGNIHGLILITKKINRELGLDTNIGNTIETIRNNIINTSKEIKKYKLGIKNKKSNQCCILI